MFPPSDDLLATSICQGFQEEGKQAKMNRKQMFLYSKNKKPARASLQERFAPYSSRSRQQTQAPILAKTATPALEHFDRAAIMPERPLP